MKTYYSLFTGCGGACAGAKLAGYTPIGGIEYHQPAADIYNLNHANPVTVADILTIDRIPSVDFLWLSPPCPNFSLANPNRGETQKDIDLATHIAKLIIDSNPTHIAIENVRGYEHSQSLRIILDRLIEANYNIDKQIYCAADYGTPTTRERLIVRASKHKLNPVVKTHQKPSNQLSLFALPNWVSWWEAIEDRIDELPRSALTENQVKAISNRLGNLPILADGAGNCLGRCHERVSRSARLRNYNSTFTTRSADMPAHTITATISKHQIRLLVDTTRSRPPQGCTVLAHDLPAHTIVAEHGKRLGSRSRILIERVGYYNGNPHIYPDIIPAPTIRAHQHIDDRTSYRVAYNVVDDYDCFAADIRCLAAWQSFPPSYDWGNNRGEAGRAIGNAVPPKLAQAVALSFS